MATSRPTYESDGEYALAVAMGRIDDTSGVNKFGGSPSIAADTKEDVWDGGGTYAFQSSATYTHVRAAVDSATTRGVELEVQGLDANWALTVQTATTDATTSTVAVALTTPLMRVFRVKVIDAELMDQAIQVGSSNFAILGAEVTIGNNQTLMAIYTVPAGKTAYMRNYYSDIVQSTNKLPNSTDFTLWVADAGNGNTFQLKHARGIPLNGNGFNHQFFPFLKIEEKHDIKISAFPESQGVGAHAGFSLVLIDN